MENTSSDTDTRPKPTLPLLCGYLEKLKHKPSLFTSWTSRYFKVNAKTEAFEYYNNKAEADGVDPKPTRSFSMYDGTIEMWPLSETMFQMEFVDGVRFVIVLNASSAEERDRWLYPIQKYIKEMKDYKVWLTLKLTQPSCMCLQGEFYKLKKTPNAFGSWNTRYFMLNVGDSKTLEYHGSRPMTVDGTPVQGTLKKSFALSDIKSVHAVDQWTFQIHISRMLSSSFKNYEDVIFTLRAENGDQQCIWLDALAKYIRRRQEYDEMLEKHPERVVLPPKPAEKPVMAVAEPIDIVPVAERVGKIESDIVSREYVKHES